MNVHHDDNHEPIQSFDEIISIKKPWQFATLGYYLPKTNVQWNGTILQMFHQNFCFYYGTNYQVTQEN
jgi:hypothetical protein